jgi:hypothetical protein
MVRLMNGRANAAKFFWFGISRNDETIDDAL